MRLDKSRWQENTTIGTSAQCQPSRGGLAADLSVLVFTKYTLKSEPKALTGDKSEGIKSRGAAEAFIRGFSPVKAEGEEFNVLILSYTRKLSRPFKENKG